MNPIEKIGLGQIVRHRNHEVFPQAATTVEHNLARIGGRKSVLTWLMTGDEQVDAQLLGEVIDVLLAEISSPDQPMQHAAAGTIVRGNVAVENRCIERLFIGLFGEAVTDQDSIANSQRNRQAAEKLDLSRTDRRDGIAVHLPHSAAEHQVEHFSRFHDREIGQFRELVIGNQKVDLCRVLDNQLCDIFQHQVRHAPAGLGIGWTAVADFLEDEMATRVIAQVSDLENPPEIGPIAVQIGRNHDFVGGGAVEIDHITPSKRRLSEDSSGFSVASGRFLGHAGGNAHKLFVRQQRTN